MLSPKSTWIDKTLVFNLFNWRDCPFCKLFLRCIIIESEGAESPTKLSDTQSRMLMDMCCSTTLFTAATDSQASDNCFAELSLKDIHYHCNYLYYHYSHFAWTYFLILAGVLRKDWLLLSIHSWFRTSLALSLFFASLTSSLLMRSLAGLDTQLHSFGWNSNIPCCMLVKRLSWQRSHCPPAVQAHFCPHDPLKGG